MKKIKSLVKIGITLALLGAFIPAQAITLWYVDGTTLKPVDDTWGITVDNITAGTITITGASAGNLDMGGFDISNGGTFTMENLVATSTSALNSFAGKVGIGTTTPQQTFTVEGTTGTDPFNVASSTGVSMFSINEAGTVTIPGALTVDGDFIFNDGLSIVNTTTNNTISVDQNGNVGTSVTTDGAIHIENTGNTGMGLTVYSNTDASSSAPLVYFKAVNSGFDQSVFLVESNSSISSAYVFKAISGAGAITARFEESSSFYTELARTRTSGTALNYFYSNLDSNNTGSPLLVINDNNAGNDQQVLSVIGQGTGDVIKVRPAGNAKSINIDSEATTANGIYGDFQVMTSGNALTLVVDTDVHTGKAIQVLGGADHATSVFSVSPAGNTTIAGNVGIGTTGPNSKLSIVGTAGANDMFDVASSTGTSVFRIDDGGNVGIGTTSPQRLLSVNAGTTATTTVQFGDIYSGTGKTCFEGANTTGTVVSFYFEGTTMVTEANACK